MKSLFLITSLLVCDLAVAQLAVGITIGAAVSAGPTSSALIAGPVSSALATCTQDPIRGLISLVNGLPLVSGVLACSSFNKKFVTATMTSTRYTSTSNITETAYTVSNAPTPTVTATETTIDFELETSTRTTITATTYKTVVDSVTTLTSTIVMTATQIPTVTLYTGTIGSDAGKRDEQKDKLSPVRYRRNAQLLGDPLPVNLPALLGQPSSIVSTVCSCVATGAPSTVATSTSTIFAASSTTTTITVANATTTPAPTTEITTLASSVTGTVLEYETVTSTISLTEARRISATTTTIITTTSTETAYTSTLRVQAIYTPRAGVCSNASGPLVNLLSGDVDSTRQQCIDKCAALGDCRFVLYNFLSGGGGSAVCSTNDDEYFCNDNEPIRSAVAIYDKVDAATAQVLD